MARLARTRMSHLFCTHFRCTRNKTLPFARAMSDDEKRERAMRDRYTRGKDFVARRGLLRTERGTHRKTIKLNNALERLLFPVRTEKTGTEGSLARRFARFCEKE